MGGIVDSGRPEKVHLGLSEAMLEPVPDESQAAKRNLEDHYEIDKSDPSIAIVKGQNDLAGKRLLIKIDTTMSKGAIDAYVKRAIQNAEVTTAKITEKYDFQKEVQSVVFEAFPTTQSTKSQILAVIPTKAYCEAKKQNLESLKAPTSPDASTTPQTSVQKALIDYQTKSLDYAIKLSMRDDKGAANALQELERCISAICEEPYDSSTKEIFDLIGNDIFFRERKGYKSTETPPNDYTKQFMEQLQEEWKKQEYALSTWSQGDKANITEISEPPASEGLDPSFVANGQQAQAKIQGKAKAEKKPGLIDRGLQKLGLGKSAGKKAESELPQNQRKGLPPLPPTPAPAEPAAAQNPPAASQPAATPAPAESAAPQTPPTEAQQPPAATSQPAAPEAQQPAAASPEAQQPPAASQPDGSVPPPPKTESKKSR